MSILLIYICYSIKSPEFAAYKRVIYLFVITDVVYNAIQITNQHAYEQANSNIFVIVHGPSLYFHQDVALFFVLTEIHVCMIGMANNLVVFVFRYFLIVRCYCLTRFQFAILIIVNILWHNGSLYWAIMECKKTQNATIAAIGESLSPRFFIGTNGESLQSFLLFNPSSTLSYFVFGHICISCIIVFIGLSITYVKIQATLKENKDVMTKSTRLLQRQLTLVMVIHVITPLILFGIPLGIITYGMIFNINANANGYGHMLFMVMVWPIVVNPICSILLIGPCFEKFCQIFHIRGSKQVKDISSLNMGSLKV
uniref:G_PROTEIN_RECEP_F1_2 domain-containing protein n=1 Tax=Rhabditophanes sp. KR3021 TaxID=114890 RepID=A0AC35TXI2_9BILA